MGDAGSIEDDLYSAVEDFEQETFESMRQGLKAMGEVIQTVPSLLKDCKNIEGDLSNLIEMADILAHPLSLMWRVGKNFLLDGVDILKKFTLGWNAYE